MKPKVVSRDDVATLRACLKANTAYHAEYDYDTDYSCEASGCDQEGICRCGSIVDFHIKHANPKAIIEQLSDLYPSDIEGYCLDRIIQHGPAGKADSYDRVNSGGYYGEEVGDIVLYDEKVKDIIEDLKTFSSLPSDVEKVKFALKKEYSYLLPELTDLKKVSVEIVPLAKLARTMRKLDDDALEQYKKDLRAWGKQGQEYRISDPIKPRGFALKEQSGYRLIDGYHRVAVVEQNTKETSVMLVVGK